MDKKQDKGLSWGKASGETEAQGGWEEALFLRAGSERQLGQPGSGAQQAMKSEPLEQRGSVPGLAQWGRRPCDPVQNSLHWQQGPGQAIGPLDGPAHTTQTLMAWWPRHGPAQTPLLWS